MRKYILRRRPKMAKYYCKWCGVNHPSISALTSGNCSKSPSKKHELYEGSEKSQYVCKNCGLKYPTLSALTSGNCSKSASKKHEPAL
jgi:transcription elongation factor Elf1